MMSNNHKTTNVENLDCTTAVKVGRHNECQHYCIDDRLNRCYDCPFSGHSKSSTERVALTEIMKLRRRQRRQSPQHQSRRPGLLQSCRFSSIVVIELFLLMAIVMAIGNFSNKSQVTRVCLHHQVVVVVEAMMEWYKVYLILFSMCCVWDKTADLITDCLSACPSVFICCLMLVIRRMNSNLCDIV